ncbi:gamma-glutamyltransferase 1 . Threonine peptidase. MEROPS family T03 [Marinomonas polaris DSM 16579]|uniref:Glutathione hydrolase proenzyme n=1 Tax=Marinomonas polaris DSM 16579 TaxID=1122206 RepID=A0A1M5K330_9GAMM|nr:gamma-glutamyltransferase [Marinomonas polaris]SHG47155.1 gamma-glutamyltransferase 1 . Threonine peptidase. MEROPS family T03 [Marinomonas polaris DSM 16579]
MYKYKSKIILFVSCFLTASWAFAQTSAIYSSDSIHHPTWAKNGMVASQEAIASTVGVDILKQGGNAVDAGVAVGFALAVTLPRAGNIGGGGFMMIYDAKSKKTIALDYREMAPVKAYKDMYLDKDGNAVEELSRFHGLAVGVPGTVAGLVAALENYGTMDLKTVMAPAIELAEKGIIVTPDLYTSLQNAKARLQKWDSSKPIFFKDNGNEDYQVGELLVQKDLANSLKLIADKGIDGFYKGVTAKAIAKAVTDAGGLITEEDLANYKVVIREPVVGNYRGYTIASMPPPSSGGIHIIEILNILENYPISEMGHNSAASIHVMAEAMKLAYADRAEYLGDPDFIKVPTAGLINKDYANGLFNQISKDKARPASDIKHGQPMPYESDQTTHFSVMDNSGNMISNTYTLNFSYGTGMVASGTGILLNNEMDDFSAKPGVANGYGLIGGDANAVEGKKRPLSSMSPTLVFKDGEPVMATGSPGGSRIITTTLQIIMNVIDHKMNIAEATNAIRVHHQWLPDELRVEKGLNQDTKSLLEAKGQNVIEKSAMGSTQSIMHTEQGFYGSSDPRTPSALTTGY